mmetsp:Transcript_4386/g.14161  ORF Transcript_4386/g.14161 Transcript_4386/m.14161 type:complete len:232 (-) Transcript_4386:1690-2385(-)
MPLPGTSAEGDLEEQQPHHLHQLPPLLHTAGPRDFHHLRQEPPHDALVAEQVLAFARERERYKLDLASHNHLHRGRPLHKVLLEGRELAEDMGQAEAVGVGGLVAPAVGAAGDVGWGFEIEGAQFVEYEEVRQHLLLESRHLQTLPRAHARIGALSAIEEEGVDVPGRRRLPSKGRRGVVAGAAGPPRADGGAAPRPLLLLLPAMFQNAVDGVHLEDHGPDIEHGGHSLGG